MKKTNPTSKMTLKSKLEIVAVLLVALLLHKVDFSIDNDSDFYFKKADIYFEYDAAKQIQKGENPYNRILEGDMLENDKYATQLPLYFYFLLYIKQEAHDNFSGFIESYRNILYFFHLLGGIVIYAIFRRIDKKFVGFCAAMFYLFNVWSIDSFVNLKQDMIAIALLLLSYYLFSSKKFSWASYILFGLSLGVKHIAIFAAPLYLTPLIFKEDSPKKFTTNILLLLATVIVPSAPFLLDNWQSLLNSMLFSVTRKPFSSDIVYGYSQLLVKYRPTSGSSTLFQQVLPRLPLLIASLLGVLLLFLKKIPRSTYLFVSIMIFAIFNPVIFPQYIVWLPPLALIALVDYMKA